MRVAFVVPYLRSSSGWRSAAVGTIQGLAAHGGVQPLVVVSRADEEAAGGLLPSMPVIALPEIQSMGFDQPRSWARLARTWLRARMTRFAAVNVVHSLDAYSTGLVGHWISRNLRVPHVVTALGTYAVTWHNSWLDKIAYSRVLRGASCICPMSEGTAALMRRYFGDVLRNKPMRTVLLGTDYYQRVPRQPARHYGQSSRPIVLSVGEVKKRKGYHVSLAAFAKVKKAVPDAQYWIVGNMASKVYIRELQSSIAEQQLTDVTFLGTVSEEKLQECYRQASVFLLTPQQIGLNFEGFGLVYIEAGAYGLPVVGTRVGGVPDAIRQDITGFVFEPDDTDGIAGSIVRLLTDKKLAATMGQANRDWAETLTWERFAREQIEVYRTLF